MNRFMFESINVRQHFKNIAPPANNIEKVAGLWKYESIFPRGMKEKNA